MGIQLGSNFTVNTALPIDDRTSVDTLAERDAIPLGRLYKGLACYVDEDLTNYQWNGTEWIEFAGGGGGVSEWVTATEYVVGDQVIYNGAIYKAI